MTQPLPLKFKDQRPKISHSRVYMYVVGRVYDDEGAEMVVGEGHRIGELLAHWLQGIDEEGVSLLTMRARSAGRESVESVEKCAIKGFIAYARTGWWLYVTLIDKCTARESNQIRSIRTQLLLATKHYIIWRLVNREKLDELWLKSIECVLYRLFPKLANYELPMKQQRTSCDYCI